MVLFCSTCVFTIPTHQLGQVDQAGLILGNFTSPVLLSLSCGQPDNRSYSLEFDVEQAEPRLPIAAMLFSHEFSFLPSRARDKAVHIYVVFFICCLAIYLKRIPGNQGER